MLSFKREYNKKGKKDTKVTVKVYEIVNDVVSIANERLKMFPRLI